jgi:hypothetical protein
MAAVIVEAKTSTAAIDDKSWHVRVIEANRQAVNGVGVKRPTDKRGEYGRMSFYPSSTTNLVWRASKSLYRFHTHHFNVFSR